VRAIYYNYWELKGMYQLARIYDELVLGHGLFDLIRLHKIFKDLGMGEPDIRKVKGEGWKKSAVERIHKTIN
jgi:hypothetical protein